MPIRTGFGKIVKREVRVRIFEVELKHRDPDDKTGDSEILIATERIKVPILLYNSDMNEWIEINRQQFEEKIECIH